MKNENFFSCLTFYLQMDPAPFNSKIQNNYSSIGGHSLETCISEDIGNGCDCNSPLVIYIKSTFKKQPGTAYVTLGDGCEHIRHPLTLDNPIRKSSTKIGARNDGFLAATLGLGTNALTLLSRTSKKRGVPALDFDILGLRSDIEENGLGVNYNRYMEVQTNLSPEDQEELERFARDITHEPTRDLMMSLADPKSTTPFFFAFRAGWNLDKCSIEKVLPFLNSNFCKKLKDGFKILFVLDNECIECNKETAISLTVHKEYPVFRIYFSLNKECNTLYCKIGDTYFMLVRDKLVQSDTSTVQKELFGIDEKDEKVPEKWECAFDMCAMSVDIMTEFSKKLNVSIKDVRGLRMVRNGVLLGHPIFREKVWGYLQNAGGFMPSLEILTENMEDERNKLYTDKLVPLPSKKHTYDGKNTDPLIDSFINLCGKALMQFCKQGADNKKTGVKKWLESDILTSFGIMPKKMLVNQDDVKANSEIHLNASVPKASSAAQSSLPAAKESSEISAPAATHTNAPAIKPSTTSHSIAPFIKPSTHSTNKASTDANQSSVSKSAEKPDTIKETIEDIKKLKKEPARELLEKYRIPHSKGGTRDDFIELLIQNHPDGHTLQDVEKFIKGLSDPQRKTKTLSSTEVYNILKKHFEK
jgi:hypothetical protein